MQSNNKCSETGSVPPSQSGVGAVPKSNSNKDLKSTPSERSRDFINAKTGFCRELCKRVPSTVSEPVCESINVILEILYIHGLHKPSTQDIRYESQFQKSVAGTLKRLVDFHIIYNQPDSWIKFWKYKLNAYFYAVEMAGSLARAPICPEELKNDNPIYLFGGIIGQWMKSYNHKNLTSTMNLTILMAKKGMPRASKELISAAEDKTLEALTSKREQAKPRWATVFDNDPKLQEIYKRIQYSRGFHPSLIENMSGYMIQLGSVDDNWGIDMFEKLEAEREIKAKHHEYNVDRFDLERELRRTAREIYGHKVFSIADLSTPVLASTSANHCNSKGKGGAVGYFKKEDTTERYDVSNYERFIYAEMDLGKEQTELYGPRGSRDQLNLDSELYVKKSQGYIYNSSYITMAYRQWYWFNFKQALLEVPVVKPIGLAEALKIRVISKGPPRIYHALKPLQMFLWKVLKDLNTFKLIGRPIHVQDIEQLGIQEEDWINSGDYQSSTDNFHSWVSETLLDEVAKVLKLPGQVVDLALKALTRHVFEDRDGNLIPQARGQLMGSIISFPFLCMANAAISRFALELSEGKRLSLRKCKMLINGDDSLIISKSEDFHDIWLQVSLVCGLESSVGKTYFNQKFCVINSCHYDRVPTFGPHPFGWVPQAWKLRPYINMGLVRGFKRSEGVAESNGHKPLYDIAAGYNAMIDSLPEGVLDNAKKAFFYYNKNQLSTFKGNWFFPTYAGGLGLSKPLSEWSWRERQTLHVIRTKYLNDVRSWPTSRKWEFWSLAEKSLKRQAPLSGKVPFLLAETGTGSQRTVSELEQSESELMKYLVLEQFFSQKLEKLLPRGERKDDKREEKIKNINSKVYMKAQAEVTGNVRAVPVEDIYSKKLVSFYNVVCQMN